MDVPKGANLAGVGIRPADETPRRCCFYGETLIAAAGVLVTREGAEDKEGVSLVWHA